LKEVKIMNRTKKKSRNKYEGDIPERSDGE
jgi:hypothetical protein